MRPGDFRLDWVGTAQVDNLGNWHVKLSGVVVGRHSYKARVTDQMSNYSDWYVIRTLTVDPSGQVKTGDTLYQKTGQQQETLESQQDLPQSVKDFNTEMGQLLRRLDTHWESVLQMPVGGISGDEAAKAHDTWEELRDLAEARQRSWEEMNRQSDSYGSPKTR